MRQVKTIYRLNKYLTGENKLFEWLIRGTLWRLSNGLGKNLVAYYNEQKFVRRKEVISGPLQGNMFRFNLSSPSL
jgi:hypothetical protein